jgi:hypothetical protein
MILTMTTDRYISPSFKQQLLMFDVPLAREVALPS